MTRIASFAAQQSALLNLQRAQGREALFGQQVTSGRKGDDLAAYCGGAEGVAALKSVFAKIQGWQGQGALAAGRLETQDLMLDRLGGALGDARQAALDAVGMGTSVGLTDRLQAAFAKGADALNAQHEGRSLFSGGQSAAPFRAGSMIELAAAPSVAAAFGNDTLKATVRLGERAVLQTGVLADEAGGPFAAAFRELQTFITAEGGSFADPLTETQKGALQAFVDQIGAAQTGLTGLQARNGLVQAQVEGELESLEARAISLEGLLAERTDVDPAEAVSKLQQAQLVVAASAQVFASLRGSSLLDVLS